MVVLALPLYLSRKYVYWPGLLGGFAAYLILAGFRGGFNVFFSPSSSNRKGFLWTLFGVFLYVWAIINITEKSPSSGTLPDAPFIP